MPRHSSIPTHPNPSFTPNTAPSIIAVTLNRAAVFSARKAVRTETRRFLREHRASQIQMREFEHKHSEDSNRQPAMLSILDESLERLSEKDRTALVMRFFADKSHAEIGAALGASEDAAQKRVARAIEALRRLLQHSMGEALTATTVASILTTSASGHAAPVGLAAAVLSSSLAAPAAATAGSLSTLLGSIPLPWITMKPKILVLAASAATVLTPSLVQHHTLGALQSEQDRLLQRVEAATALGAERARLRRIWLDGQELEQLRQAHRELLALREELANIEVPEPDVILQLEAALKEARAGLADAELRREQHRIVEVSDQLRNDTIFTLKNLGLSVRIWATENEGRYPRSFVALTNELSGGFFTYNPEAEKLVGRFENGLTLDSFEWMPHSREVSGADADLALFREKEPRALPDGTWERAYAMLDGSVEIKKSTTGDFSEWDRKFTATDEKGSDEIAYSIMERRHDPGSD